MSTAKGQGRPPAFQFYAKDWISSKTVRMLNPTQRGYYIQLLAEAWDSTPIGTLPNDPAMLRILAAEPDQAEWDKHSPAVIAIFKKLRGNLLASPRLIKERDKQIERKAKCKLAGHISANSRKDKRLHGNKRSTDVATNAQQEINSSSSSSISSSTKTIKSKPSPAAIEIVPAVLEITSAEETETLPADNRHIRVKALVRNAWSSHNGGIDCPWDGGEGKQLKALLNACPRWHDSQFAQCLANMYASSGYAIGTRPREFLPRLPKYLHGPLNEFNREKNANGRSGQVSKAAEREQRIVAGAFAARAVIGATPVALPNGNGATGEKRLAEHAESVLDRGSLGRGERTDPEPAG